MDNDEHATLTKAIAFAVLMLAFYGVALWHCFVSNEDQD